MPAFIPAIIGAAGSIVGGVAASRKSKEEKNALNTQSEVAKFGLDTQKRDIPKAEANLDLVQKFWQGILGGGTEAQAAIAPEKNQILSQFDTGKRAIAEKGARGGGTTAASGEAEFGAAGQLMNLLFGARTEAGNQLKDVASILGSLGTQGGAQASSSASNILGYSANRRSQDLQLGKDIGGGLAGIMDKWLNRKRATGTPDVGGSNAPGIPASGGGGDFGYSPDV